MEGDGFCCASRSNASLDYNEGRVWLERSTCNWIDIMATS